MYQVIIYDNSGKFPRPMHHEDFLNEDCAWAWFEMKENDKIRYNKSIKLEFKYMGNNNPKSY